MNAVQIRAKTFRVKFYKKNTLYNVIKTFRSNTVCLFTKTLHKY